MSAPKLESIMLAIMAAGAAIVDGNGVPVFKTVARARVIGQSFKQSERPVLGVQRLIDREDRANFSLENQKTRLVFQFQVIAASTDQTAIDTELVQLKDYLSTAFLNNRLGGLCGNVSYFGADSSNFAPILMGSELVAYETVYSETKPAVH